jgi:hypothetical protein
MKNDSLSPLRLGLLFTSLASAACALTACSSTPNREASTNEDDLTAGTARNGLWQSRTVVYCFERPLIGEMPGSVLGSVLTQADLDQRWERRKQEFIGAIAQTWQAVGVLNLVARDGCQTGQLPIRYNRDTPTGGFASIGRTNGLAGGVQMDAEFLGQTYPWGANTYHTFTAAHEMGHALGFRHEQDRSDSTCRVSQDFSGVGIPLTGYDPSSIMNYCDKQRTLLTDLDKAGFRSAYAFLGSLGNGAGTGTGGGTAADTSSMCGYWARIGECSRNPGYMLTSCAASCRNPAGATCRDSNGWCSYWASVGECSNNPNYMLSNCCASCLP